MSNHQWYQFHPCRQVFERLYSALFTSTIKNSTTFNHGHGWALRLRLGMCPWEALALGWLNNVTQVGVINVTQVLLPLDSSKNKSSSSLLPPREDTSTSRQTWDLHTAPWVPASSPGQVSGETCFWEYRTTLLQRRQIARTSDGTPKSKLLIDQNSKSRGCWLRISHNISICKYTPIYVYI